MSIGAVFLKPEPTNRGQPARGGVRPRPAVIALGEDIDDVDLVRALRERARWAPAALYDRYSGEVERLIVRLLGAGPDVDDVFQEVFAAAFRSIYDLREPNRLRSWLLRIVALTVREHLRAKKRRRWLVFLEPETVPEMATSPKTDAEEAAAHAYELLDQMSASDRIPLVLHLLTTMSLAEIADTCGVSLATVKRRISRAERWFHRRARKDLVLMPWTRDEVADK